MDTNDFAEFTGGEDPERRIFSIDTGNLPPAKAMELVKQTQNMYRSKVVHDAKTGEEDNILDEGPILDESKPVSPFGEFTKFDEIAADIEACRELDDIGVERIVLKYVAASHHIKATILDYQRIQDQRRAAVASEVAAKAEETGKKLTQAEIDRAISVDEEFVGAKSLVAASEIALATVDRAIRIFERIAERAAF